MGPFMKVALVVVAPVVLSWGLEMLFRREYTTHTAGGVFITGASSGIGLHAAETLATEGFTVFAGVRKQADAERIAAMGIARLQPVLVDVTSEAQVDAAVSHVAAALQELKQPLVALVNNAGIPDSSPVEIQAMNKLRGVYEVNLFGVYYVTQSFLPLLRSTGAGARIVNIGSLAGWISLPGTSTYAGTKHALEAMSDALRLELLPAQISVSLIKPGYIQTNIGGKADSHLRNAKAAGSDYTEFLEAEVARHKKVFSLAPGPAVTSAVILDAITSKYPKTRYFCGTAGALPGVLVAYLKWLLPDRAWDLLIIHQEAIDALLG